MVLSLVAQLLAFSRRQPISPRVIDLNALVGSMQALLTRLLGETTTFEAKLGGELWPVRVDPAAFEQVVLNLAVNGRDAMPSGGRLTIETRNAVLDATHELALEGKITSGEHVVLAVTDTGTGMDAKTRERLFEPFFTTKAPGAGTGLGLSTCFGIVKQVGGHIAVRSEPGHGSTFEVFLPRAEGKVEPLPRAPVLSPKSGGDETVLVVEDNADVRAQTCRVLRQAGYRVLEAEDGPAALSVCEREPHEIHLLLTDVVMPGANGREVAEAVRRIRPAIKVLFMSGYTENAIVHHGVVDKGVRLVQKPFTPAALMAHVRATLDEPGAAVPTPGG